jgi:hypothetical protein
MAVSSRTATIQTYAIAYSHASEGRRAAGRGEPTAV